MALYFLPRWTSQKKPKCSKKKKVRLLLQHLGQEAPIASAPQSVVDPNAQSELSMEVEFDPSDFEIDLDQVKAAAQEDPTSAISSLKKLQDLLGETLEDVIF